MNAQRAQFGQSSEKKCYVLGEDQISLFNEAESCHDPKAEEPSEETFTVKAHTRKKKRTIDELAKNLPVGEVLYVLPEDQMTCEACGNTFRLIGKKLIRREMVIIPQQAKILEYYSCSYACDNCEKSTGFAHILTTQTPPPLMKHSLASPSIACLRFLCSAFQHGFCFQNRRVECFLCLALRWKDREQEGQRSLNPLQII